MVKQTKMHIFIRFISLIVAILVSKTASQTVQIYTLNNFRGSSLILNVSSCVRTLPSPFLSSAGVPFLNSIDTKDNCVQLYRENDCFGNYLIVKPGTQHEYLSGYGWANAGRSIGPCHAPCDPKNIHLKEKGQETAVMTIKAGAYFQTDLGLRREQITREIPTVNLTLKGKECVDVPPAIKQWPVTSTIVTISTSTCVEGYFLPACKGESYRLTLGSVPALKRFEYHVRLTQAGSFSICGRDCDTDTTGSLANNGPTSGKGIKNSVNKGLSPSSGEIKSPESAHSSDDDNGKGFGFVLGILALVTGISVLAIAVIFTIRRRENFIHPQYPKPRFDRVRFGDGHDLSLLDTDA